MRTREQIEKTLHVVIGKQGSSTYFQDNRQDIMIELLLDIRDLLENK